jgi:D-alanine-D-alanine ligase
MRKLRVMVLMHQDLVPPDSLDGYSEKEILEWKTEYDVLTFLGNMGHDVLPVGVCDDLGVMRKAIEEWKPQVVFNLLEEFHGVPVYDHHVVSYLELMRQPYTGCNPRGLMLSHDKVVCKEILAYHRIPTPRFCVFPVNRAVRRPRRLAFPLLVKSAVDDGSVGISQASVVHSDEKLAERVQFVHEQCASDAIAEEYIEGRELYVSVVGNQRLETYPVWEMCFARMGNGNSHIATAKVKWDPDYQKRHGIQTRAAQDLPPGMEERIIRLSKRIYRALSLSGYARIDLRLTEDGRPYILEANPNPNVAYGEDFAESAASTGISYEALLQHLLSLGVSYQAAWRG